MSSDFTDTVRHTALKWSPTERFAQKRSNCELWNRELILVIRERGILYTLMNRHTENITIENKYLGFKAFIDQEHLKRLTAYEYVRIRYMKMVTDSVNESS